mmetsp:Transcript_45751/g.110898  ORF Transcript_45751/g.110898 Transcript_45751/m.110898 type:complete len:126 (-) Transcript_45751:1550-1927(-)
MTEFRYKYPLASGIWICHLHECSNTVQDEQQSGFVVPTNLGVKTHSFMVEALDYFIATVDHFVWVRVKFLLWNQECYWQVKSPAIPSMDSPLFDPSQWLLFWLATLPNPFQTFLFALSSKVSLMQ